MAGARDIPVRANHIEDTMQLRIARLNVLVSVLATFACTSPGEGKVAYVGMELWDGTGAPVIHDAVMIVAAGRIEAAGPPDLVKVPRGASEVRLDGRWVIPGLVDAHAHVRSGTAGRWLAAGVTSVRDLGGPQSDVVALRDATNTGEVDGPRLFISGAPVDGLPPTWPFATTVRLEGEARRAVGDRVLLDVNQIAVGPRLDRRLLEVLLDEARALETPVAVELGAIDAATAARLGVQSIELLTGLPDWPSPDSIAAERMAELLVNAGVRQVPGLLRRGGAPGTQAAQDQFLRRFRARGGLVATGTDAGLGDAEPGTSLHQELLLLVAAGFSSEQALLAATRDGARLLGADSLGTLVAGRLADFVVLLADPLADIVHVARVESVIVGGRVYDPATIGRTE